MVSELIISFLPLTCQRLAADSVICVLNFSRQQILTGVTRETGMKDEFSRMEEVCQVLNQAPGTPLYKAAQNNLMTMQIDFYGLGSSFGVSSQQGSVSNLRMCLDGCHSIHMRALVPIAV